MKESVPCPDQLSWGRTGHQDFSALQVICCAAFWKSSPLTAPNCTVGPRSMISPLVLLPASSLLVDGMLTSAQEHGWLKPALHVAAEHKSTFTNQGCFKNWDSKWELSFYVNLQGYPVAKSSVDDSVFLGSLWNLLIFLFLASLWMFTKWSG